MRPHTLHIRWCVQRDLARIQAISDACFTNGWTPDDFLLNLRRRDTIIMCAEYRDEIIGFMVYRLHATHLELPLLAVHPDHWRRAVGAELIAKLAHKLVTHHRRERIVATVNEVNTPALLFFREMGFRATGIVRGREGTEDGVVMEYVPADEEWMAAGRERPVNRVATYYEER